MKSARRRWAVFLLKLLVTIIVIGYLIPRLDWPGLANDIRALSAATWVQLIMIHSAAVSLLGIRLAILTRTGWLFAIALCFRAQFFLLFAPAQLGTDVYRIYGLNRAAALPVSVATSYVVLDRIVGVVALAGFAAAGAYFFDLVDAVTATVADVDALSRVRAPVVGIIAALLSVAAVIVYRQKDHFEPAAHAAYGAISTVSYGRLFAALSISLVMLVLLILMTIAVMAHQDSLNLAAAFAVPPVILVMVMAIPISIGGIGVREYAAIALYGVYGIDANNAVLFTTIPFIAALFASVVGLLLLLPAWLGAGGRR